MKTNEPVRQHLVPRCYLKNFALAKKKEWYIDAYDKTQPNPVIFKANTKNICVETDFYTFKNLEEKDKRFMERYYSNTVEADYTEVYNALINRATTKLSKNMRFKIISYVICQFFRTSKLTNTFNNLWNRTLEHSSFLMEKLDDKKVYLEGGGHIDFTGKTLGEVQKWESERNREMINVKNYELYKKWTIEKLDYLILVYKCKSSYGYIIGDNPVVPNGHIFDPSVHISMPLNHNHCLVLVPSYNGDVSDRNKIHHISYNDESSKVQTMFSNISQYEASQRLIMGKTELIQNTLYDIKNFNEHDYQKKCQQIMDGFNQSTND